MSKGLDALQHLYVKLSAKSSIDDINENLQEYEIVRKNLTALEIIKEKRVDIGWLSVSLNCSRYNLGVGKSQALKKKEYDLLKEILL